MTTALVTGATAGIGRQFALQLAARKDNLVLVARDVARLEALSQELRDAHGVSVEVMSADLADRDQLARVAERVGSLDEPVDLVVNNAGASLKGDFLDNDIEAEEAIFDVLTRAVFVLSHAAGRAMRERGSGRIINVASVAAFTASGTYAAEKAFVTVFSEGLATDLKGTGVTVTALCPGYTRTEFHERADLDVTGLPGFMWLDAERLVRTGLADADKGKVLSIPSPLYKATVQVLKHSPRAIVRSQAPGLEAPKG